MDDAPRTRIFGAAPNVPETFCTDTPAERPSRLRLISPTPLSLTSSAMSWSVAPVNIRLSIFCIPVTTTDAISWALGCRSKSMRTSSAFLSEFSYPRNEARIVSVVGYAFERIYTFYICRCRIVGSEDLDDGAHHRHAVSSSTRPVTTRDSCAVTHQSDPTNSRVSIMTFFMSEFWVLFRFATYGRDGHFMPSVSALHGLRDGLFNRFWRCRGGRCRRICW